MAWLVWWWITVWISAWFARRFLDRRKVTKNRGSFPNDDALVKLYYLALRNIRKKWTMPIQNWKVVLNRFTILFGEHMPQY